MNAEEISNVAVIGAGTMGSVIAGEFARAGCQVALMDLSPEILERGLKRLADAHRALCQARRMSRRDAAAARRRISPVPSLEQACEAAQLVIEAASENPDMKRDLFAHIDRAAPRSAILASNTSGLSISAMARATRRPSRVAGMHFWNPPHIIPLVEVTRGASTSAATVRLLMQVCRRIGKRPILVRHDIPGFVGNRLQFAAFREALHLLSEGVASAEDIDAAMTAGPGLRYGLLGPLRTADLGGLDIFLAISQYLFPELCRDTSPPPRLAELVKQGRLGAKSGQGFYSYSEHDLSRFLARRDRVLLGFLNVLENADLKVTP